MILDVKWQICGSFNSVRGCDCADIVEFPIVLKQDGQENSVLWVKCPGRKPLIEHVRPLLYARLDLQSVGRGRRVEFHLRVGSVVKADWSAPAELFAVSFFPANVKRRSRLTSLQV